MELSSTPRARFSRKKFISHATTSPYRSPLMHNLPEKKVQSSSESISDVLKVPTAALERKQDVPRENLCQMQQKFISPIAASSSYQSPLASNLPARKCHFSSECLSLDEIKTSTMQLWEKNKTLREKIEHLEQKGFKEEEYKWYIEKLHKYNEIKDMAQMVMGRLAIIEQKTIKEVHEDFNLAEND